MESYLYKRNDTKESLDGGGGKGPVIENSTKFLHDNRIAIKCIFGNTIEALNSN